MLAYFRFASRRGRIVELLFVVVRTVAMSSSSSDPEPDPRDPQATDPNDSLARGFSAEEAKAVKTFSYEVSAGNRLKLEGTAHAVATPSGDSSKNKTEQPAKRPGAQTPNQMVLPERPGDLAQPSRKSKTKNLLAHGESRATSESNQGTRKAPLPEPAGDKITATQMVSKSWIRAIQAETKQPLKRTRRGLPSSTISLILHGLIIMILSVYTLGLPPQEEELALFTSTAAYEELEDFQDMEIDPSEELESLDNDLTSQLVDPGEASFGDLSAESMLADVSGDEALGSDSIGEFGNLFGDAGSGDSDADDGDGARATAIFFGTKIEGKRILYLLDNSGGMKDGKLETLIKELLLSVASLQPRQEFYVIFYSDTIYPLFFPQPATDFVRANKENHESLRNWLDKVELRTGNKIDEALNAAVAIQPDTVFLLTDGELFTTEAKKQLLLDGGSRNFSISTFGMGIKEKSKAATQLRLVAEANRGTYRVAEVSPELIEQDKD